MNFKKSIYRKILKYLPGTFRYEYMRKHSKINQSWPSPLFEIKIADTEAELAQAYKLLHDSYVQSGFMNPAPTGMRVLVQHVLPQTTTIVAKWDSKIIGTLSIIRDNSFGLPLEKIFHIDARRTNGRRLAEVSSLTIDPSFRGQADKVLFPMIRFVTQYARYYFGVHEFVIAVNPSMVDFYIGYMCFEKLKAKAIPYDFVKGAPAVGLFLNFETADARWKQTFDHRPLHANFYKFWTTIPSAPENRLPERKYASISDPILTPELLSDFFIAKAKLNEKLSKRDYESLMAIYPFSSYQQILQPHYEKVTRRDVRYSVCLDGKFGDDDFPTKIYNVSKNGLLININGSKVSNGDQQYLKVVMSDKLTIKIRIEIINVQKNNLYGAKIVNNCAEWMSMVNYIEGKHLNRLNRSATAA
jgi:hypothetical protein